MTVRSDGTAIARSHFAFVVQLHGTLGFELPALALVHTRSLVIEFIAALVADANGAAIGGKARLQAFPRATYCVTCKQREERR